MARPKPAPRPSGASGPVGVDPCDGLEPHQCAKTRGCILDQPTYSELRCRAAENRCESAVRHADLIGRDADPNVTDADTLRAIGQCQATPRCTATAGHCSCACHLLGNCDCECGGSYLPRCVEVDDRDVIDGRPPSDFGTGPLADLGRQLVLLGKRPRGTERAVTPLPKVEQLVGLKQNEIEGHLGTGRDCKAPLARPCTAVGQRHYRLFASPSGVVGPELLLTYDDKASCTAATVVRLAPR